MKIWKLNFGIDKIRREYEKRAVTVTGMIGSGKDLLTANVIERRGMPHISNCPYNKLTMPYNYEALTCGGNTYRDFVEGTIKKYDFPYFDGCDIYLSDCGIYFPSQYCNELNKQYKFLPTFMALSRQLAQGHVHTNCQNLNRIWDKIREMSDLYIYCRWVKVIRIPIIKKQLVLQYFTMYDKAQSCMDRVKPCMVKMPILPKREVKAQIKMYKDNYTNTHGMVRNKFIVYINKASYDTRFFKALLKNGKGEENENNA